MAIDDKAKEELSTLMLELLVGILSARESTKVTRDQVGTWLRAYADPLGVWGSLLDGAGATEVRDLAYGVAGAHLKSLTELTKISEQYSTKIAERLKAAKQPRPAGAAADLDKLMVCPLAIDTNNHKNKVDYTGDFTVPVAIDKLPTALLLRALEGGSEFPVTATFTPVGNNPKPGPFSYDVEIKLDDWIEKGKHYKALLPLKDDYVVFFKLKGA